MAATGELDLDDPIATWVPAFPGGEQITVRQLLNHSSGIVNYPQSPAFLQQATTQPGKVWTPEELVAFAASEEPLFAPGEGWAYSNTNYILAGMILEAVSGQEVASFLRAQFLVPQGLESTFLDGDEAIVGDLAHGHQGGQDVTTLLHPSAAWTAGAIAATAGDLARWARALYNGTATSEAAHTAMVSDPLDDGSGNLYGLGTMVVEEPLVSARAFGHNGSIPGYASWMLYQPEQDVAVAAIINDGGKNPWPLVAPAFELAVWR